MEEGYVCNVFINKTETTLFKHGALINKYVYRFIPTLFENKRNYR